MTVIDVKRFTILQLLAILAATGIGFAETEPAGCPTGSDVDGNTGLAGYVADIQPSDREDGLVRIGVATGALTAGGNREVNYVITVTAGTPIFRQIGKNCTPASIDDLETGQLVHVWVEGPVAESYPMQARAGKITIDSGFGSGSGQ